jgi:hypothetical protein
MKKMRRAEGGRMPEEEKKEEEMKFTRRKHGGKVMGKESMHRPDRRARGGATSDRDPTTTAGRMSKMPFESDQAKDDNSAGAGTDKD